MSEVRRTLVVERVEPGLADPGRLHAVLAVRDRGGHDGALHLFTSDPMLAACLEVGVELEIRANVLMARAAEAPSAPIDPLAGRCASCRWRPDEPAFLGDGSSRACLNPDLRAEPMAEPGARFGGVAVEPAFGCVQWDARQGRG